MSVEAVSWALNLAPVPLDRNGKPNTACAFVLVGLANHADPDGTASFPSVPTLARYTRLSERHVRTALDRLEAEGIIRPCDPAIVAARIRRADKRPQGFDLNVGLIRDDLTDDDIRSMERQHPGLRARVATLRAAQEAVASRVQTAACDGVKPLHPVPEEPVENSRYEVKPVHPVTRTGCNQFRDDLKPLPPRGEASSPEPSIEPSKEPPTALARARDDAPAPAGCADGGEGNADEFFDALGEAWPLAPKQRDRLTGAVALALRGGWQARDLAAHVGANTSGVRDPYAVLAFRLEPGELPAPPTRHPSRRLWCGQCDERTRFQFDEHGLPGNQKCPVCGSPTARPARLGPATTKEPS
jgi:hypothetical protein